MRTRRIAPVALIFTVPWAACSTSAPDLPAQARSGFIASDTASIRLAEERSLRHLFEDTPEVLSGVDEVWSKRVHIDELGQAHTRVIQTVDGVPVFGAQAVVHLDASGSPRTITDRLVRHVDVDTRPRYHEHEALDIAVDMHGGWDRVTGIPRVDLQILRHHGEDRLTYRVQLEHVSPEGEPSMPVVFIDGHTLEPVWSYDNLQYIRDRRTYTAHNSGGSLPGTLVRSESSDPSGDLVLDQAHDNVGLTYDYYFTYLGRDSFDGNGATIHTTVHYGDNYVNAFWNGTQMVYGDGDGELSGPLTVLDVVAHELTHAVTQYSSNLIYANESGALNEAISDIFGAAIEAYRDGSVNENTWKIGDECWAPGTPGSALRYMNNPALASDYDYYPERYTGTADNGGVHWNSGIANLAFYLMVEGGSHPRGKTDVVVPPLDPADPLDGINKGAAIFYRANTVYLTPDSTFSDARVATLAAAADLFGDAEVVSVQAAWDAVGVPPPPEYQAIDTRTDLSAATGAQLHYSYATPPGATHMKIQIAGGTGDADLYVKHGSQPTTASYDCRPYRTGNSELCVLSPALPGTYHVMLHAYASFSDVTLTVSAAGADALPEICDDGIDNDGDGDIDCDDEDCASAPVCQPPVESIHIGDLDGVATPEGNQWRATVTLLVVDSNGGPVAGAAVTGAWSGATFGDGACVTGADGLCAVQTGRLRPRSASVTFTVTDIAHATYPYDAGANTDPDGDSDGTRITLLRP